MSNIVSKVIKQAMKKKVFLPFWILIFILIGCTPHPQGLITAFPTSEVEIKATPSPSLTPSSIPETFTPSPSPSNTWTPGPTFTSTKTHTPVPSLTPIVIMPDVNEPQCFRREDLQETKITTVLDVTTVPGRELFCIEWLDLFENEIGFRIILKYDNTLGPNGTGEIFIYEVGPNSIQLIVPHEHAPRLGESQDQCNTRKSYSMQVIALGPDGRFLWSEQMAKEVDCHPFTLPTSTITITATP